MDIVTIQLDNRVGTITLNRPEKRNALDDIMVNALKTGFASLEQDPGCKIIVLKANGEVFCAGADLAYLQKLQTNTYEENLADSKNLMALFSMIYRSPKLVVAQVQGHAIAGGCGLATVCDFCFAVPEAQFGYTEVKIGFIPAIVSVFLRHKIGEAAARKLLLTGSLVSAAEAQQVGMINEIVEADQLDERVHAFVSKLLTATSGDSIALTKQLLADLEGKTFDEGMVYAAEMNAKARATKDCKTGITAFLNKEKLSW